MPFASKLFSDIDDLRQRLLPVWPGLEQSLIDDAVDQWPTRLSVFVPMVNIFNIPCDCQFVFSVLNELCFTPCLMQWVIF